MQKPSCFAALEVVGLRKADFNAEVAAFSPPNGPFLAASALRMHRMPLFRRGGHETGGYGRKPCRLGAQNAQNGDYMPRRQRAVRRGGYAPERIGGKRSVRGPVQGAVPRQRDDGTCSTTFRAAVPGKGGVETSSDRPALFPPAERRHVPTSPGNTGAGRPCHGQGGKPP